MKDFDYIKITVKSKPKPITAIGVNDPFVGIVGPTIGSTIGQG
jgi:hypothetical protein